LVKYFFLPSIELCLPPFGYLSLGCIPNPDRSDQIVKRRLKRFLRSTKLN